MTDSPPPPMWKESPNYRPGEPLRSWLQPTPVVKVDAIFTVRMADAAVALARLLDGEALSLEDQVALARVNSYSVARWYEPVVTFLPEPHIDPDLGAFYRSVMPLVGNDKAS